MLHATNMGNSALFKRYLGYRDEEERKVHEEDEITSIVLGPLDFLQPAAVHEFWRCVLVSAGYADFLPNEAPAEIKTEFWPRRKATDNSKPIIPDAHVTMTWPDSRSRILLIELKWRAGLSGYDQLHRQWQCYLSEGEQKQALHLFIAPEVSVGVKALSDENAGGNVWQDGNRLVLLPWLQIRSVLVELEKEYSPLGRWAGLAARFLGKIQIRKFSGFRHISVDQALPTMLPNIVFWQPPHYWSSLSCPPALPDSIHGSIFFTNSSRSNAWLP